jgi:hypothetical protein
LRDLTGLTVAVEGVMPETAPAEAAEPVSVLNEVRSPMEQPCPSCQARRLYRSKARTLRERIRRKVSARRLYRCTNCDWRGWLIPLQFSDGEAVEPSSPPNLAALDVALQMLEPPLRRSFSPRDLN